MKKIMCEQFRTEEYFLRLKSCTNWQSVVEDPILGPIVPSNYELVKQDFIDVKKKNR